MKDIAQCDWIIEVVVERLDIKQKIFEQVEKYRKPGTLITSNTSGIPIHLMAAGRSDDFKNISAVLTLIRLGTYVCLK
jgi:3-hydroxyacyl-CoA dehydrogenase